VAAVPIASQPELKENKKKLLHDVAVDADLLVKVVCLRGAATSLTCLFNGQYKRCDVGKPRFPTEVTN
jgi:hypothetical protein